MHMTMAHMVDTHTCTLGMHTITTEGSCSALCSSSNWVRQGQQQLSSAGVQQQLGFLGQKLLLTRSGATGFLVHSSSWVYKSEV